MTPLQLQQLALGRAILERTGDRLSAKTAGELAKHTCVNMGVCLATVVVNIKIVDFLALKARAKCKRIKIDNQIAGGKSEGNLYILEAGESLRGDLKFGVDERESIHHYLKDGVFHKEVTRIEEGTASPLILQVVLIRTKEFTWDNISSERYDLLIYIPPPEKEEDVEELARSLGIIG
jgi:hypothetical protein